MASSSAVRSIAGNSYVCVMLLALTLMFTIAGADSPAPLDLLDRPQVREALERVGGEIIPSVVFASFSDLPIVGYGWEADW